MPTYEELVVESLASLKRARAMLDSREAPDTARAKVHAEIGRAFASLAGAQATRELREWANGEDGVPSSEFPEAGPGRMGRAAMTIEREPNKSWWFVNCPGPHASREVRVRAKVIDPTPRGTLSEPNPRRHAKRVQCTATTSAGTRCTMSVTLGEAERTALLVGGAAT